MCQSEKLLLYLESGSPHLFILITNGIKRGRRVVFKSPVCNFLMPILIAQGSGRDSRFERVN